MGQKESESCDSVTIYPEVVGEGVFELNTPLRLCRGVKRKLRERINACFSSTTVSAGRARCTSTRGTSWSRRFFSTATHSSTSSQSNWHFSRGSGRREGIEVHGGGRISSWGVWKRVEADFREVALHILALGTQ